jgi:hypothetical protein
MVGHVTYDMCLTVPDIRWVCSVLQKLPMETGKALLALVIPCTRLGSFLALSIREEICTNRKMIYNDTYDFLMVPTNNFNRHKKWSSIFCDGRVKHLTQKILIFVSVA